MGAIFSKPQIRRAAKRSSSFNGQKTWSQKHPRQIEQQLQIKCTRYVIDHYPEAIVVGDMAGADLTDNGRIKMRATRSEDGQPDMSVDIASREFHGFRAELKPEGTVVWNKNGTLRKQPYRRNYYVNGKPYFRTGDHLAEQWATILKYRKLGYWADFIIGYDEFARTFDWYMDKKIELDLF